MQKLQKFEFSKFSPCNTPFEGIEKIVLLATLRKKFSKISKMQLLQKFQ